GGGKPDGSVGIDERTAVWRGDDGIGDVLAGIIGGLLAQGLPAFEDAAAGVWLHGKAGQRAGKGLTAEELEAEVLPL
ncbi:NAD(P)H-hydrate dehydratase, partial [Rhizobium ruizarguesonis]